MSIRAADVSKVSQRKCVDGITRNVYRIAGRGNTLFIRDKTEFVKYTEFQNQKTICYTGYHARPSNKHSQKEIAAVGRKVYPNNTDPARNWVEYLGAEVITIPECDKMREHNAIIQKADKAVKRQNK